MLHQLLPHTISSDVREGVQIKLPSPYQPLQYACRSCGNGGQGTAVVIRRDAKSLLTLELHCNIILLDMTLHSCKCSHIVLYLHVYLVLKKRNIEKMANRTATLTSETILRLGSNNFSVNVSVSVSVRFSFKLLIESRLPVNGRNT